MKRGDWLWIRPGILAQFYCHGSPGVVVVNQGGASVGESDVICVLSATDAPWLIERKAQLLARRLDGEAARVDEVLAHLGVEVSS